MHGRACNWRGSPRPLSLLAVRSCLAAADPGVAGGVEWGSIGSGVGSWELAVVGVDRATCRHSHTPFDLESAFTRAGHLA